ncbi:hypothetical protein HNQ96_001528 [Aminobacter lissarensis]|uniref:Uncharacterized protein n=1 Tax=Aminobacter carboxidus TaxID=376165 RepID=A0A8E2BDC3_9HYPH|nr:hypothetical protein [Aminobacter lissarensis]MBB6465670.1 hypothetical protein [Aminobacter lissarensis]
MVEHAGRIRAAIDVIAKHDDQLAAGQRGSVADDLVFERRQLLVAAMDVADGIDNRVGQVEFDPIAPCGLFRRTEIQKADQSLASPKNVGGVPTPGTDVLQTAQCAAAVSVS